MPPPTSETLGAFDPSSDQLELGIEVTDTSYDTTPHADMYPFPPDDNPNPIPDPEPEPDPSPEPDPGGNGDRIRDIDTTRIVELTQWVITTASGGSEEKPTEGGDDQGSSEGGSTGGGSSGAGGNGSSEGDEPRRAGHWVRRTS